MGLLDDKVVLVTGASNGIGRASVLCFAREGARAVLIADIDDAGGEAVVEEVRALGVAAHYVHCDVADEAQVAAMVAAAVEQFGQLHCAYNNAGLGAGQAELARIDRAGWDHTLDVNLTGTWLCMKYELEHMLDVGGGAIVNQSSATAFLGFPLVAAYGATKAAIMHLTMTAAVEYAARGIRVNALAPGPIRTDMVARAIEANPGLRSHLEEVVPMGRIGEPDEVAQAAAWLLSDRSSYVTGVTIPVDGAQVVKG